MGYFWDNLKAIVIFLSCSHVKISFFLICLVYNLNSIPCKLFKNAYEYVCLIIRRSKMNIYYCSWEACQLDRNELVSFFCNNICSISVHPVRSYELKIACRVNFKLLFHSLITFIWANINIFTSSYLCHLGWRFHWSS